MAPHATSEGEPGVGVQGVHVLEDLPELVDAVLRAPPPQLEFRRFVQPLHERSLRLPLEPRHLAPRLLVVVRQLLPTLLVVLVLVLVRVRLLFVGGAATAASFSARLLLFLLHRHAEGPHGARRGALVPRNVLELLLGLLIPLPNLSLLLPRKARPCMARETKGGDRRAAPGRRRDQGA